MNVCQKARMCFAITFSFQLCSPSSCYGTESNPHKAKGDHGIIANYHLNLLTVDVTVVLPKLLLQERDAKDTFVETLFCVSFQK